MVGGLRIAASAGSGASSRRAGRFSGAVVSGADATNNRRASRAHSGETRLPAIVTPLRATTQVAPAGSSIRMGKGIAVSSLLVAVSKDFRFGLTAVADTTFAGLTADSRWL